MTQTIAATNFKPSSSWAVRLCIIASIFGRMLLVVGYGGIRTLTAGNGYGVGALCTLLAVWSGAFAFLALAPVTYTSQWTLILPTATSGMSLQVETIGHAQSMPSSPFGSATSSPKVIYREIINSDIVIRAAAELMNQTSGKFGRARVKLVDETSVINFAITGSSPSEAQNKANALIEAFNFHLDKLRADEVRRRAEVVQGSLVGYTQNLKDSRERILNFQRESGMLSITQFNESATSVELLRRKLADIRAELGRLTKEQESLVAVAGVGPDRAASALKFIADPSMAKLADEVAQSYAAYQNAMTRYGAHNPVLLEVQARYKSALAEIQRNAELAGFGESGKLARLLLVNSGTDQARILNSIVSNDAQIKGRQEEATTVESDAARASSELKRISHDSAALEDLRRDHLVAEAVFTSAMARMDTNKVDIYGSYPMVQTLSNPDLPSERSSPNKLIVLAGGIVVSIFTLFAWGLAWCKHIFIRKRRKSA